MCGEFLTTSRGMVNTRIRYFDVAKGLAILCVILSHSAIEAQSVAPSHIANTISRYVSSGVPVPAANAVEN